MEKCSQQQHSKTNRLKGHKIWPTYQQPRKSITTAKQN
jgi:hypothetical protein